MKAIPEIAVLMDDLRELNEYHTRNDFARQLKQAVRRSSRPSARTASWTGSGPSPVCRHPSNSTRLSGVFPELREILVDQCGSIGMP